ncbi:MAG: SMP-30/gluconolactonase/LRE family protein [Balneolaceae bacterium]
MKTLFSVLLLGFITLALEPNSDPKAPISNITVDTFSTELDGGTGGISIDKDGNIYVADFGQNLNGKGILGTKVFKITPGGEASVFASDLKGASGNGFDSKGNLYQSNIMANYISRITPEGETSILTKEGIVLPVGIELDADDNLYIANCGNNTIRKVTQDGTSTLFAESDLLNCPNGIVFDEEGNLFVANFSDGSVLKITPDAQVTKLATVPGNNNGHLIYHNQLLYVVGRGAHQVYTVSLTGEVELLAGTGEPGHKDGPALEASFFFPNDIGVSPDGKILYVNEVAGTSSTGVLLSPMLVRRIHLN